MSFALAAQTLRRSPYLESERWNVYQTQREPGGERPTPSAIDVDRNESTVAVFFGGITTSCWRLPMRPAPRTSIVYRRLRLQ